MSTTHTPPRLEVRLRSRQALRDAMTYRRFSVRTLAMACGNPKTKSTIGNLRSGARTTCGPRLARAIEEALGLPQGNLFDIRVSTDHLDTPTPGGRRRIA